jgi:ferrochelatase
VNLGTPDDTSVPAVRRYLDEFLMDGRVIDISDFARFLLVKLIVLPRRPRLTGEAYEQIWTEDGSPLLFHTERLAEAVRERLGADVPVEIAMRYGNPSIASALDRMRARGVDRLVIFPLYPQYASATTGTVVEKVWELAGKRWNTPSLVNVGAFYDDPGFIEAERQVAAPALEEFRPEHVVMSFHGVPERHIFKGDESPGAQHCLKSGDCCDTIGVANRNCYRAHCIHTARAIARALALPSDQWTLAFQSKFGRDKWIEPATDALVVQLAQQGKKRIAVMCPAFVADCIETLEEIAIRAKEDFVAAGGEDLLLVPSLNAHPAWADTVARLVLEHRPEAWA